MNLPVFISRLKQNYIFTYVAGSNMLASMKHCVAIGGVGCWMGKFPAGFKFKAFAAAWGICNPVPIKVNLKKDEGNKILE